jgi:hypothetical protein
VEVAGSNPVPPTTKPQRAVLTSTALFLFKAPRVNLVQLVIPYR